MANCQGGVQAHYIKATDTIKDTSPQNVADYLRPPMMVTFGFVGTELARNLLTVP